MTSGFKRTRTRTRTRPGSLRRESEFHRQSGVLQETGLKEAGLASCARRLPALFDVGLRRGLHCNSFDLQLHTRCEVH